MPRVSRLFQHPGIDGHEFVDMGAAGKWATMNVGAESSEGIAGAFGIVSDEPYLTDFEKYAGLPVRPVVAE